jgi:ABC-2 type transport system permease protein
VTLALAQIRSSVVELVRYPSFSVPALLFPTVIFAVFKRAYDQPADTRMAGFAAVAILGVVFFQFGVGIAAERVTSWETYLRTLPVAPRLRIVARVCSGLVFAVSAASVLIAFASATTPVSLPVSRWPTLVAALVLGAIPFGLLGIALGYLVPPKAALPVANLLYLPLSYAGGLWMGPRHATGGASAVLDLVPTHGWATLLWTSVGAASFDAPAAASLVAWGGLFGLLAVWAYRRDEGQRYR